MTVADSNRIRLEEILAEEIIDNELMATSSANVVVKCRFAILTPASWLSWIKAHLGVGAENEVSNAVIQGYGYKAFCVGTFEQGRIKDLHSHVYTRPRPPD